MNRVGLIGFGAIGTAIVAGWGELAAHYELSAVCVRERQREAALCVVREPTRVCTGVDELLAMDLDLYVEAAGHAALVEIGERVLRAGRPLFTLSIGAFADEDFEERMRRASAEGGGRLIVPPGAMAGFDGLMTLRESGLKSARYVSTKPPIAWRGTPAEEWIDLVALSEPVAFFHGSAREAARLFPKNANLAAAVALAGLGFEKTEVELVADPGTTFNTGQVFARTESAELCVSLQGESFGDNPRSSAIVSSSVISAMKNAGSGVSFG